MTSATLEALALPVGMPDHTQLPDEDPSAVHNDHEHPQSSLLTECLLSRLEELYPDGQYWVGADVGIYFTYTEPVLDGCRVPDWVFVLGVPPLLDGDYRKSYVLWKELIRPAIVMEFVSTDGSEERDRTPRKGKFWIYERVISAGYYVIFDPSRRTLEVFSQNGDGYHEVPPNEAGRFLIKSLNVELGIWEGTYRFYQTSWLRMWDASTGKMLPFDRESLVVTRERADAAEMGLEERQLAIVEQTLELEERGKRIVAAEKQIDAERQRADEKDKLAESERRRADEQQKLADAERRRADEQQNLAIERDKLAIEQQKLADAKSQENDQLKAKLRALGIDPDA